MTFLVVQIDPTPDLEPFTAERAILATAGGELRSANCRSEAEIAAAAADADVAWVGWDPGLSGVTMGGMPRLRLAMRWGVGYEQIDVAAATELGIAVANAPSYGTEDVAEHAIALLLAAAKRIVWNHEQMRTGGWPAGEPGSVHRLLGRTLGVVGVGRIGSAAARRGLGLGLRVIGCDIARSDAELRAMGVEPVDLATLAATADYVTVHVPYSTGTHQLIDGAFLARMRPGAILVNTSRGKVLDQGAVGAALRDGRLASAALDVFEQEPLAADDPIRSAPNVILTPHSASFSDEAMVSIREEMANTVVEFMTTGWAANVVNPQVRERLRPAR